MQTKSPLLILALVLTVIAAQACDDTPPDHFRDFDTGTGGGSESDTGGSGGDGGGSLGSPGDGDGDSAPVRVCGDWGSSTGVRLAYENECAAGEEMFCEVDSFPASLAQVCCIGDECRAPVNGDCTLDELHVCNPPASAVWACGSNGSVYLGANSCVSGTELLCKADDALADGAGSVCCKDHGGAFQCELVAFGMSCNADSVHVCDFE
jgi:hypothetical protein